MAACPEATPAELLASEMRLVASIVLNSGLQEKWNMIGAAFEDALGLKLRSPCADDHTYSYVLRKYNLSKSLLRSDKSFFYFLF